ncbi:glycerophosphodiester phosphodiesterase family protein [uncultured Prevotella sp.]|uniref:glycerophosphodiester phosphodiesterase n=1 Tax=uncultured Prevotella sp. TaxID=159272 RepID=UPI0025E02D66|nr:glycerophosphodiester phosphodiesterase family protein [uncultured Prevotella sp.]
MKRLFIYIMLLMGVVLTSAAKNRTKQVIAHRGYWNIEGSAQNSISSLQNTYKIGVYGSEFDVHITRDGEVVVFHDDDVEGIKIENANYVDIKDKCLKNGERIPKLQEYLAAAKSLGNMKLILEVKEHIQKSDEDRCIDSTLKMVNNAGLADRTEYISFSKHACDYIVQHAPQAKVSYLNGDLSPHEAKEAGYTGIDYEDSVFMDHPSWIKEAHQLGLVTNVWTVDDLKEIKYFFRQGIDFVTTNEPVKAKTL